MTFVLPKLPYEFDALEPHIDAKTMEIHHDKHHQTYVTKLNEALAKHPEIQDKTIEDLLKNLGGLPEDIRGAVKNHGGGHANHSLFWTIMTPETGKPFGELAKAVEAAFGSVDKLKEQMIANGIGQFGSGWSWLVVKNGKLSAYALPNQDSPLSVGDIPILGIDVWEHAYYLKYQNKRDEYLKSWLNVVNWEEVGRRFKEAVK